MTTAADAPPALRIGCLGAARIAPDAIVYPSLSRGDVALVAVAARDPASAERFARQHGFARAVADYAAVVAAPDIDLVYNPLPINLHAQWTISALESGKHVLCEKPFAMNLVEAGRVLDVAARTGRRVIEALHYRYHPGFATLLGWIGTGRIGRVRRIEGRLDVAIPDAGGTEIRHLPETGGGAFMDLGCYPLNWALSVAAGEPRVLSAQASLTPRGVDEALAATLGFDDDVEARLSVSMKLSAPTYTVLRIEGDDGQIVFENPGVPQRGYRLMLIRKGVVEQAPVNRATSYFFQMEAVVDGLATGVGLPSEGAAILRQQGALDAIYDAAGLRHLRYPGT